MGSSKLPISKLISSVDQSLLNILRAIGPSSFTCFLRFHFLYGERGVWQIPGDDEVQKAVNAAQSLHQRWSELMAEGGGYTRNCCCDLQALLVERGAQGPIWQPGADKYSRLDRQLQNANSQFIEEQQIQQQVIVEQQDEQLELVSGTIGVLKNMSERIGMELDEQAVMLDDFSHEMDNTQSKLDNVMKKLAKVSHMTSDRRQWCAIGVLLAILFVIILLFFIL
uniref:Syntaxin 6 n=1 Tax=Amphilophus citrinellus TaxID=61819 RepID=A0A3Q0QNS3_AMPCI